MSKPRHHSAASYNALKTAWKRLVHALGGVDATAACTRGHRGHISEWGAVHSERFPPLDVILDAEAIAGEPFVTDALATAMGYRLVQVTPRSEGEVAIVLARVGKEAGDVFAAAAMALADGKIDDAEREALVRELRELERAAAEATMVLMRGAASGQKTPTAQPA